MSDFRRFLFAFWLCLAAFFISSSLFAQSPHWTDGSKHFAAKEWAKADEAFQKVIDTDKQISPDLCYALGNTRFRQDRIGEAVLWYRRALVLDPSHSASKQNMRLIARRLADFHSFTRSWQETISATFPPILWKTLLSLSIWGIVIAAAVLVFLNPKLTARVWLWVAIAACLIAIVPSALGLLYRTSPQKLERLAVVTQADVSALSAPTETGSEIISLPPGSEISIVSDKDTWVFVSAPGDRLGWIKKDQITRLWPYAVSLVK